MILDEIHRMDRVFDGIFFPESDIDRSEEIEPEISGFSKGIWPISMKRSTRLIYLKMQMRSSGYSSHSDLSDEITSFYFGSLGRDYLFQVLIDGIICFLESISFHIVMSENHIFSVSGLSILYFYNDCVCDGYDRSSERSADINAEMASIVLHIVSTVASHIYNWVCVVEDICRSCFLERISKQIATILRNLYEIRNRKALESTRLVYIFCLGPIWYVGDRRNSPIKWIGCDIIVLEHRGLEKRQARSADHVREKEDCIANPEERQRRECIFTHSMYIYL